MLQKEFEALTGRHTSAEEYEKANRIHTAAENMDKQAFCRAWTEGDFRTIAESLADAADRKEKRINELLAERGLDEERAKEVARNLQEYSDKYGDEEMKTMAHLLVGDHCATRMALKQGCSLNQYERTLILEIMK